MLKFSKIGLLAGSVLVLAWLVGCEHAKNIGSQLSAAIPGAKTSGTKITSDTIPESDYHGPRARLAVLRFSDATGGRWDGRYWYNPKVGDGMARKLSSSLLKTRRFRVLNRKNMDDMMTEIGFGGSGAVQAGTAARFGRMVGAQLVVTAAITDFEENTGGTSAQGQNRQGVLGVLGSIASNTRAAYMAVNVEVVDVETSELLASEQIEAEITDTNLSGALGSSLGFGSLGSWQKQPRGQAFQKVINQAVQFIAANDTIPQRYFTEAPTSGVAKRIEPNQVAIKMQGILKELGYYHGTVDGLLGPGSEQAIKAFQKDYDLDVTGALDTPTREKLLALVE